MNFAFLEERNEQGLDQIEPAADIGGGKLVCRNWFHGSHRVIGFFWHYLKWISLCFTVLSESRVAAPSGHRHTLRATYCLSFYTSQ